MRTSGDCVQHSEPRCAWQMRPYALIKLYMDKDLSQAAAFTLADQHGTEFAFAWPRAKACVFIFADRESAGQIEGWARPLYEKGGGGRESWSICGLSSVPSFLRGVAMAAVKSLTKYSVLLDWTGSAARAYGCATRQANCFIISKQGRILAKYAGAAQPENLMQAERLLAREKR